MSDANSQGTGAGTGEDGGNSTGPGSRKTSASNSYKPVQPPKRGAIKRKIIVDLSKTFSANTSTT